MAGSLLLQVVPPPRSRHLAIACPLLQVRSFAKEGAMLGSYEHAQQETLRFGLRSAALDGVFFPLNNALATGGRAHGWVGGWVKGSVGAPAAEEWVLYRGVVHACEALTITWILPYPQALSCAFFGMAPASSLLAS